MVDLLESLKNVQIMANDIPNFVVKAMKRYIELIIFLSLEFLSKGSWRIYGWEIIKTFWIAGYPIDGSNYHIMAKKGPHFQRFSLKMFVGFIHKLSTLF